VWLANRDTAYFPFFFLAAQPFEPVKHSLAAVEPAFSFSASASCLFTEQSSALAVSLLPVLTHCLRLACNSTWTWISFLFFVLRHCFKELTDSSASHNRCEALPSPSTAFQRKRQSKHTIALCAGIRLHDRLLYSSQPHQLAFPSPTRTLARICCESINLLRFHPPPS
jgi:hypothetical protein